MKSLGNILREKRHKLGLDISQVSIDSAVPSDFIVALENEDLASLPAECFAVGFLRSYCRFLNIDAESAISQLQGALSDTKAPPKKHTKVSRGKSRFALPSITLPALRIGIIPAEAQAWLAISGILLLGWFTYSAVVQPSATTNETRAQAATVDFSIPDSIERR